MPNSNQVESFTRLLMANQGRLYGYIFTLVQNRHATEEILQEASTVLWRKFDQFEPETDFGAWGMKVARFSVFEWRRKQARLPLPMDEELLDLLSREAIEVGCDAEAQFEALEECIGKLSERDQSLVADRYHADVPVSEIAAGRGRSRVAVYKMLSRIHRDLLACMESQSAEEELV